MHKKGQTLSLDLLIAVIIFMAIVALFVSLIFSGDSTAMLRDDAERLFSSFDKSTNPGGLGIIEGNQLKTAQLQDLINQDYETLKGELGITGDFCIVVVDDTGGLIRLGERAGEDLYAYGPGTSDVRPASGIGC